MSKTKMREIKAMEEKEK